MSETCITLFCASIEEELKFKKLNPEEIKKVVQFRDAIFFFTEYASVVVSSTIGPEVMNNINIDKGDYLFELYWISTVINPEISWLLKNTKVERSSVKEKSQETVRKNKVSLAQKLPVVESFLKRVVIGQNEAIEVVLDSLYRHASGLNDKNRPMAVLLFTGPSGVGKSYLAKMLSNSLLVDEPDETIPSAKGFFRVDCTLYQQRHEISNLIGSPMGYVGSDNGSPLPDFLREHPDGNVILIDEVEKAHQSLHKMFMGLFDYGVIRDNKQKEAFAHNTIFIMTSNAGSREATDAIDSLSKPIGFVDTTNDVTKMTEKAYKKKLEEIFPPEFRGRIDETVIFSGLNAESCRKILDQEILKIENNLKQQGIRVTFTEAARQNIVKEGFSPILGARNLSSVMRSKVIKPLSRLIVKHGGKVFVVRSRDGNIMVEAK